MDHFLKTALALCLILGGLRAPATGQALNNPVFAGIELGNEGIQAIAIRIAKTDDTVGTRLVSSETIDLSLGLEGSGSSPAQVAEKAAAAVGKLLEQLKQQYRVPPEQTYIFGRSGIDARLRGELASAIKKRSEKTVDFLDQVTETQLSIVGIIPKREKVGSMTFDNRGSSVLVEVGNYSTRGGYEVLRYSPAVNYDFVTMNVPQGTISFTDEVIKAIGPSSDWTSLAQRARIIGSTSVRQALRNEISNKPGLVNRKRVYLTGGIVEALVTLLYPGERQRFVPLTVKDIADFAAQALRNQQVLLKPDLSEISDRKLRQEVEKEVAEVKNKYTSQQLIAGAELLKVISSELNWQDKKVSYARFGQFGCILSYVRLKAEK